MEEIINQIISIPSLVEISRGIIIGVGVTTVIIVSRILLTSSFNIKYLLPFFKTNPQLSIRITGFIFLITLDMVILCNYWDRNATTNITDVFIISTLTMAFWWMLFKYNSLVEQAFDEYLDKTKVKDQETTSNR